MTDQERLEGVKGTLLMRTYQKRPLTIPIDPDDVEWLIEQTEKSIDNDLILDDHLQLELKQAQKIKDLQEEIKSYKLIEDYYIARLKNAEGVKE